MADGRPNTIVAIAVVLCLTVQSHAAQQYLGRFLGKLSELHHGVTGEVYAVDAKTLHIKDFTYDGEGPAAYFWAGNSRTPGSAGFKVRDENGSGAVLKRYRKKGVTITLPDGKNLNNIKWFSVWCDEFAVNFGDVKIPKNFDYPKPQKIEALRGVHGVSSDNIVLVDAQTLLIPNLSYDGEAPDAKFWVGRGAKPSPQGIRVPDENSKEVPLRRYDRKTVVLTLPGDLTVFDIGHFGIWCEAFTVDFGHVQVPANLNIPPSLKMLGVSPQSKLNCEVLYDDLAFEVRWAVAGESIVLQLVAKLDDGEYMSFGLSGDNFKNQMIGGDVVVAWVDRETLKGYADDYFLEAKSQCSGPTGSCPDERLAAKTNNIRLLNAAMVNGYSIVTYQRPLKPSDDLDRQILTNQSQAIIWAVGPLNQRNEVSFHSHFTKKDQLIDFGRPAKWNCPMPESDNASQAQNSPVQRKKPEIVPHAPEEPSYPVETTTKSRGNERRRGGNQANERRGVNQQAVSERSSQRQEERPQRRRGSGNRQTERGITTVVTTERARTVPTPRPVSKRDAWHIPPIQCYEPDDGVFYAQMGPTGGKKGYPAITGHVGWGISWYINGLLIPEINVVRGKTYTFVVEGGLDPEVAAKYHPFYITDDSIGGYEHKTPEEKQNVHIFAGAKQTRDGKVHPTGIGRLCHWTHTGDREADEFQSFGAFQRTLELRCDDGEPGVITWTPDKDTPDTVYYQCFTHRHLGWKINVLDSCDAAGSRPEASEPEPAVALPDNTDKNGDLSYSPSLIYETRIKPNDILFQTTQTNQAETDSYHPDDDLDGDMFHQHFSGPEIITLQPDKYDTSRPVFHLAHQKKNQYQPNLGHFSQFSFDSESPRDTSENMTSSTLGAIKTSSKKSPYSSRQHSKPYNLYRRPGSYNRPPPFIVKPMIMHRPQGPYKKSFYRIPTRKQRPHTRPIPYHQKMSRPKPNQEPILIMKHADSLKHVKKIETSSTTPSTTTQFVETITSSELPIQHPSESMKIELPPAINTGFHPESVVIEGGFKPILTKQFEDRMIETDDSDYKDDIGVIRVTSDAMDHQYIEHFEPMFIPSPPDSRLLQNKNHTKLSKRRQIMKKNPQIMFIVRHVARSAEIDEEPEDDEMAMAAERVEAYYLPPDDKKPVDRIKKPSNIDIPAGTVVTYDGKTVSGVSLTAPVPEPGRYEARSSKAAELLKLSPQFGPFRGEIPPLDPQNINVANLAQLKSQGAVINRDLNAPSAPATSSAIQTTKLSPARRYRKRRNAHHTPEHTAEQERLHHDNHTHHHHQNSASINIVPNNLLAFIGICCVISYIQV